MKEETKKKDWRPIWIYLLVTIIVSIAFSIISIGLASRGDEVRKLLESLSLVISNGVIALIFIILYHDRLKKDLKRINKRNIIFIIISAIVIISLNELIAYIFELLKIEMSNQNAINDYFINLKIPTITLIVLLAPFIEEIMFRYSLETICKTDKSFIIISGLVFGFAHGIGIASLLYIFIGMCLSIIYIKNDKNIIAPMSVHFLNNLISVIEMLIFL